MEVGRSAGESAESMDEAPTSGNMSLPESGSILNAGQVEAPVSYTHLDVYKRQGWNGLMLELESDIARGEAKSARWGPVGPASRSSMMSDHSGRTLLGRLPGVGYSGRAELAETQPIRYRLRVWLSTGSCSRTAETESRSRSTIADSSPSPSSRITWPVGETTSE